MLIHLSVSIAIALSISHFLIVIMKPILLTGLVDIKIVDHILDTNFSFVTVLKKNKGECFNLTSEERIGKIIIFPTARGCMKSTIPSQRTCRFFIINFSYLKKDYRYVINH